MIDSMDLWVWGVVVVDLAIAIAAIAMLRWTAGRLFGFDTTEQLAAKNNFAFGFSLAGGVTAIALILAGAGAGEASHSLSAEALSVLLYAVVGIALLKIGLIINDLVTFNNFSMRAEIGSQNVAASIVQAANLVALGLLIHAAIDWVDGVGWQALVSVCVVFFLAQLVLLGVTRYRAFVYSRRHPEGNWQSAVQAGNVALATRYAGQLIGSALASSSAGGMVTYISGAIVDIYLSWILFAIVLAIALAGFSVIARTVVLAKVNVVEEVDRQQNLGVAAIEASIFIGVGLVMNAVIG